jgi:large subunit ribosomal protein L24
MKFKVGDLVLVTGGKDKGKQGKITRVVPSRNAAVVEGVNLYVKHIKPYGEQAGQRVRRERALPVANIAILNDQGKADRVGYLVAADGTKQRVFKKTGKVITASNQTAAKPKKAAEPSSVKANAKEAKESKVEKKTETKKTKVSKK